jgi:acetyl-CoA C-acetyltransferase
MEGSAMINREFVILSAVRAPIGKFGGALKDVPPTELAANVVRESVKRSGLPSSDIGNLVFGNVFAAQVLAVRKELGLPPEKTNPNGSGISLGHPLGATGAIVTVKAIHELHRIGGKYALVTMCIGGGQGIAAILQSMN